MDIAARVHRVWAGLGRPWWALILPGGGVYALFTQLGGCLALFERMSSPLFSFGASAGAASGALLAAREPFEVWDFKLAKKDYRVVNRLALLRAVFGGFRGWTGLYSEAPMIRTIRERILWGDAELAWPHFVTAVDLMSGLALTHRIDNGGDEEARWIYDSMSVPLWFENSGLKADGGLLNNVPVDEAAALNFADVAHLDAKLFVVVTTLGVTPEPYEGPDPRGENTAEWIVERALESVLSNQKLENLEAPGVDILVARLRPGKARFHENEKFPAVREEAYRQMNGQAPDGELWHIRDGEVQRITE